MLCCDATVGGMISPPTHRVHVQDTGTHELVVVQELAEARSILNFCRENNKFPELPGAASVSSRAPSPSPSHRSVGQGQDPRCAAPSCWPSNHDSNAEAELCTAVILCVKCARGRPAMVCPCWISEVQGTDSACRFLRVIRGRRKYTLFVRQVTNPVVRCAGQRRAWRTRRVRSRHPSGLQTQQPRLLSLPQTPMTSRLQWRRGRPFSSRSGSQPLIAIPLPSSSAMPCTAAPCAPHSQAWL